jgi:hypothetical protein
MNIQDGVEEYISYYTDTIQLYIEQSNIISLLQKYNDDMKHGNIYNEVDVNDKLDVIDEGDEDEDDDDDDDDDDEGECVDKNDEGECVDKNDEGEGESEGEGEGDDRYVFKCYHCKKLIVQDSEEHDRCITGGDCDDWFCGDCHEFCPCDEDEGDNERNNDEGDEGDEDDEDDDNERNNDESGDKCEDERNNDESGDKCEDERNNDERFCNCDYCIAEKVYIKYNLPNNIVQEYIKETEKSYDNKPSLRYRKIYKKEVFEQEEEDEEKEKE